MSSASVFSVRPSREVLREARRRAERLAIGLYPHQVEGVAFLLGRRRAILAADMGLGKTRQSIIALREVEPEGPYLVVCPASVKRNWSREIEAAAPGSSIHIVGESPERDFRGWAIVNYDMLRNHVDALDRISWAGLIFDEAHYLKNHTSQRSKHSRRLIENAANAPVVHCLTGTPLANRPRDLFPLLQLVNHPLGKSFFSFAKKYCAGYDNGYGLVSDGASNLEELALQLHGVMLRRTKDQVLDLPRKVRTYLDVEVPEGTATGEMRRVVETLLLSRSRQIGGNRRASSDRSVNRDRIQLLALLTKARRKLAIAKVKGTIDFVRGVLDQGEKVIVFSSFDDPMQSLAKEFGEQAVVLTGATPTGKRQDLVDRFQNDPNVRVFVANLIAGGVGVNLTAATQVVFNDLDWVPANHFQAEDRAYRIGQTRRVQSTYLIASGTVDEFVRIVLETKAAIVAAVVDGQAISGEISGDILTDLENTLFGLSPGLADVAAKADPAWVADVLRQAAAKYKAEHAGEFEDGGKTSRPPLPLESIELLAKILSGPQEIRFKVTSSSDASKSYTINLIGQDADCSCPGFEYRGTCKHVVQLKTALSKGGPLPGGFEVA